MPELDRPFLEDINTVPNHITAARLALTPLMYRRMVENPAANWWKAGLVAVSDNLDGFLARLEDKHPDLGEHGFRRSETGRKLDPVVDKIFTGAMLMAGVKNRSVPRALAYVSLAQKAAVSALTLDSELRHKNVQVSYTGKLGELVTNLGFGGLMASPAIERPVVREAVRTVSAGMALAGVGLSTMATVGYARQSGRANEQPSHIEGTIEEVSELLVRLPNALGGVVNPPNPQQSYSEA